MFYPIENYLHKDDISRNWNNWVWQEQCSIREASKLLEIFPSISKKETELIKQSEKFFRFKLTPYMLSLIQVDDRLRPIKGDPIWNQFVPIMNNTLSPNNKIENLKENWELPEDMINPVLQHKYRNRVNLRIQNRCLAYCMYCFEAKRVLGSTQLKQSFNEKYFEETLDFIRENDEIEELVLSGGDPLLLSNSKIDEVLTRLRALKKLKAIRIQTRAFIHNPFRIDNELIDILIKHDVTAIGIHVSHPIELTLAFEEALKRLSSKGCRVLTLAHIPLLKGINDNEDTLKKLFMDLYAYHVKPYYLIHAMPDTLGAYEFRTSVRKGVEIMKAIKRNVSNPAVPEYIIVHAKGKHTVPLELNGTPEFEYINGRIKFVNWKNEICYYEDSL